jgi:hypothetical protein
MQEYLHFCSASQIHLQLYSERVQQLMEA